MEYPGVETADERLRNIVAKIVGYAELLDGEAVLPDERRQQMARIVGEAVRELDRLLAGEPWWVATA